MADGLPMTAEQRDALFKAVQEFEAVIDQLQAMRLRFVTERDAESLSMLAGNLEVEVW